MAFINPDITGTPAIVGPLSQNQISAPISAGGAGLSGTSKQKAVQGVNVPNQTPATLTDYLNANVAQGQQMAQGIAGQMSVPTSQISGAIPGAVDTYTGQLYNQTPNQGINTQVANAPGQLTQAQQQGFQTELNAGANVPNSASTFENSAPYANLNSQIQQAVSTANNWGQANNLAQLEVPMSSYEAPGMGQGDTELNSLLVSQTPGAYQNIANAVANANALPGQLQQGTTQADSGLQQAIANDQATTLAAQGAGNTYASNLNAYLQNALTQANATGTSENSQLQKDLSAFMKQYSNPSPPAVFPGGVHPGSPLTPTDLKLLGLSGAQESGLQTSLGNMGKAWANNSQLNSLGYQLPTFSLSDYLTQNTPANDLAEVASPQQYADVQMLQNLEGANAPSFLINPSTSAQAGLSNQNLDAFKLPGLSSYLGNATTGLNDAGTLTNDQNQINALKQNQNLLQQKIAELHSYDNANPGFPNPYGYLINADQNQINSDNNQIAAQSAQMSPLQAYLKANMGAYNPLQPSHGIGIL